MSRFPSPRRRLALTAGATLGAALIAIPLTLPAAASVPPPETGWTTVFADDFNGGESEGVGYFQVTQKNGRRMSTARAFLKPAAARKNLTILTGCLVQRIRFDGKRAVGVEFLK